MEAYSLCCVMFALSGLASVCNFFFCMPSNSYVFVAHFSENWGWMSLAPIFGGNIFSLVFGHNMDVHSSDGVPNPANVARQCRIGRLCYVETLYLTNAACFLCVLLSVLAGWRDRRKLANAEEERKRRSELSQQNI